MPEDDFPADYGDRIKRVCTEAAEGFRACPGDLLAQLRVCAIYFNHGEQEGVSHGELIDFLGISSPPVFDHAGYSDEEGSRLMEGLDLLVQDENGITQAPRELPVRPPETSANQTTFNL